MLIESKSGTCLFSLSLFPILSYQGGPAYIHVLSRDATWLRKTSCKKRPSCSSSSFTRISSYSYAGRSFFFLDKEDGQGASIETTFVRRPCVSSSFSALTVNPLIKKDRNFRAACTSRFHIINSSSSQDTSGTIVSRWWNLLYHLRNKEISKRRERKNKWVSE